MISHYNLTIDKYYQIKQIVNLFYIYKAFFAPCTDRQTRHCYKYI